MQYGPGSARTLASRLIGMEVEVRQYANHLEVYYKGRLVERMDRVHGAGEAGIDYRHVIGSLVRKPGAFARYRYREHVPHRDLPPGLRCTSGVEGRACRRGVRTHPSPGRHDHGVGGGPGAEAAAGCGLALRLRGGAGVGGPGSAARVGITGTGGPSTGHLGGVR